MVNLARMPTLFYFSVKRKGRKDTHTHTEETVGKHLERNLNNLESSLQVIAHVDIMFKTPTNSWEHHPAKFYMQGIT